MKFLQVSLMFQPLCSAIPSALPSSAPSSARGRAFAVTRP